MQKPLKTYGQTDTKTAQEKQTSGTKPPVKQNIKLPESLVKLNTYLKENFCTETEVVGVEIQPEFIRVCQAREVKGKWQILKLSGQQVLNTSNQDALTKNKKIYVKALKDIFENNKIQNRNVAIAIPASVAIIKTISLPLMSKENLDRATRIPSFWQNLVQLSENISEYLIYYRIIKENPATKEMDVLFVACKNQDLQVYSSIAEEAGLKVVVADVGCFSINNLSKLKETQEASQKVFLKIGKDENYLQVIEQGKPAIYDIFVPENEKSYLNEYLDHQTFIQRFISQVKHIIARHEEKSPEKIKEIEVISSEQNVGKFIETISDKFDNIKVKLSDLFDAIELPEKLKHDPEIIANKSAWAIATGLATRKLNIFSNENDKNVSETVNLLPNSENMVADLKARFYSKILLSILVLFSVGFMVLYSVFSYSHYRTSIVEITEFNRINKEYQKKQKLFNDINNVSAGLNKLIKIKDSLNLNQRINLSAMQEISGKIPEGVWLEEINIFDDGKIMVYGKGYEEQPVINFSKELDKSETMLGMYISNIKSVSLENGGNIKEFSIQGSLNGIIVPEVQDGD